MNAEQLAALNPVVRRIESDFRTERGVWYARIRFVPAEFVRAHSGGLPGGQRIASSLLTRLFYWPVWPLGFDRGSTADWRRDVTCPGCSKVQPPNRMSIDHIRPIARGGLELDRSNLRFLCLACNLRRGTRPLRFYHGGADGIPRLETFA